MELNDLIQSLNLSGTPEEIATALNAKTIAALKPGTLLRFRTLAMILDPIQAATISLTMRATAAVLSVGNDAQKVQGELLSQSYDWMSGQADTAGIDVGVASVRGMIDMFVPSILSAEQAAAIKAYGETLVSPAESIGFGREVDFADVVKAMGLA